MPRMSGPLAALTLRNLGYTGILCGVSGNTLDEDVKRFIDHGATFVLPKPLDMEALKALIPEL